MKRKRLPVLIMLEHPEKPRQILKEGRSLETEPEAEAMEGYTY